MYDAVADPYCYPGTIVLKNLLDIRDQETLDEFEADYISFYSSPPQSIANACLWRSTYDLCGHNLGFLGR